MQVDKEQATNWLSCLMFIYFDRYDKAKEYHTGEMAYGFGAFLSLKDVTRISELPDLLYTSDEGGNRPSLLDHTILMYLDLIEDGVTIQDSVQPVESGQIEIYFDQE